MYIQHISNVLMSAVHMKTVLNNVLEIREGNPALTNVVFRLYLIMCSCCSPSTEDGDASPRQEGRQLKQFVPDGGRSGAAS